MVNEKTAHLHLAYCKRNRVKCTLCQQFYDKHEEEEHMESHERTKCKYCKLEFEEKEWKTHEFSCKNRPKTCQYCKVQISFNEYHNHLYSCGSRTKKCDICQKPIILRGITQYFYIKALTRLRYPCEYLCFKQIKYEFPFS